MCSGRAWPDDPKAGPYLRTGDLGFFQDGELFITGRARIWSSFADVTTIRTTWN